MEEKEYRSCKSKRMFLSKEYADRAMIAYEEVFKRKYKKYKCKYCNRYHLATDKSIARESSG